MSTTDDFEFSTGTSGYVSFNGLAYGAGTGAANCITERNVVTGLTKRAMFQFDTSSIPATATVEVVEFELTEAAAQPANQPDSIDFYIGSFIGAALNGNAGEYNGGTYMFQLPWIWTSDVFYDMALEGNDPTVHVALGAGATTDVAIRGNYTGGLTKGRIWNALKNPCTLRVTYSTGFIPRLALMGVGGSWLVATVVGGINLLASILFPDKFYRKTVSFKPMVV